MSEGDRVKQFAEDIAASYEARAAFVQEIVGETHELLDRFRTERERMAATLREHLAKSESLRRTDFNRMMGEILAVQQAREEGVKAMLQKFREEEEQVARRLRGLIGRGAEIPLKSFKRTLVQIKEDQQKRTQETVTAVTERVSHMQQEVGKMLEEFKGERERMRTEWSRVTPAPPQGDNAREQELAVVGRTHVSV